jgi:site-specific recombinase XerD
MSDLTHLPYGSRLLFLGPLSQDHVAAYLTLQQARVSSPRSLEIIVTAIQSFCRLLPEEPRQRLSRDLACTTPDDIDAWLDAAEQKGFAPTTRAIRISSLRRFFDFLIDQGHLSHQPVRQRRHQITLPQRLPRPMADADLVAFFRVIDRLRDRLLFLVMLRCGLRCNEARTLRWSAIDWEQGTIRIDNSKGAVDRIVYFSSDVETTMRQWQGLQAPGAESVFASPDRKQAGGPLHVVSVHRLMAHYVAKAGLKTPYTSHALRHAFATNLLNAGAPLEVVKELMGHTSLDMTLRYAKLYDRTKRQHYDRAMEQVEHRHTLRRR